ncbi:MAG: hypothetical protein KatS3mg106_325 [Gemmataceae bacterium]|nr:MAG: hypothetical protein KatS3mg106_325 [Gemmataceae bacterium]
MLPSLFLYHDELIGGYRLRPVVMLASVLLKLQLLLNIAIECKASELTPPILLARTKKLWLTDTHRSLH